MSLDASLQPQRLSSRVRDVGINPDHWYPLAWADRLKLGRVQRAVLWQQPLAVYRQADGTVRVLADACLHKGVPLHKGTVERDCLVCPYHGWRYDGDGRLVAIPYLKDGRVLPTGRVRAYPVRERYNIVWVFPGDPARADAVPLPAVPEFDDPNWLVIEIPARFGVHFSIVNENPLDTFHGHLHRDLQGWYDPVLLSLEKNRDRVEATYEVTFRNGFWPRFLGLTDSRAREIKRQIIVGYHYPHCRNTMPGLSNYYFFRCPVGLEETRSFALLCLKIRLPGWLVARSRKPLSALLWRFVVKPFLDQDIDVMASEQAKMRAAPDRQTIEINPVIAAAQRLTVEQYDVHVRHPA